MYIDIEDQLKKHKLRRYELAQKIDVTYPTITSIYNSTSTSIKFDTLEKICTELNCTPNDILKFGNKIDNNYVNKPVTNDECDFLNPPE